MKMTRQSCRSKLHCLTSSAAPNPSGHPSTSANLPDDELSLPPIHTSPSIITVQPSSFNGERHRSSRQPMPIAATLDWISSPRSHLSVFSGIYFLSNVEQLEIQQVVDLNTLLGRSQNRSQYRVKVPRGETIFLVIEDSKAYRPGLLRSSRELILNVMDPSGETAFIIKKNWSCGYVPGFLHKVTVESADFIGSVEQNFTVIGTSFTVYNDSGAAVCHLNGPNLYSCCMSDETHFQIVTADKSRQVASLIRQWDKILVDYSLLLTFTSGTSVKLKGLLLGAALLLELLFFERRGR